MDELAAAGPALLSKFSSFERADELPALHHSKCFRGIHLLQKKRDEDERKEPLVLLGALPISGDT